jgi:hypothetical protein
MMDTATATSAEKEQPAKPQDQQAEPSTTVTATNTTNANDINGTPDSTPDKNARPRGIRSGWSCVLLTIVALLALVGVLKTTNRARQISSPHQYAYANKTIDQVVNRASVVQPLVDTDQRFDIGVTVWARDETIAENILLVRPHEKVLFSDIVFSNLSMEDAQVSGVVEFELPLAPFREVNLTNIDLRASFVLIPRSPSLLDHAKNVSSWIPASVSVPPVRSWSKHQRDFRDEAIDAFGISIPLVHLHGINSRCLLKQSEDLLFSAAEDKEETAGHDDEDSEDDEDKETGSPTHAQTALRPRRTAASTQQRNILLRHPYLITRTQLRLIRETRLYSRRDYNKAQKELRRKACGQTIRGLARPHWFFCGRDFSTTGPFETRFELDMGSNRTEWAYAPFLTTYSKAPGRKDYVPIPVNRENCSTSQHYTQESMKVEWKLSFATVSPIFHAFGEKVNPSGAQFNWTDTEYEQRAAQKRAAIYSERIPACSRI